MTRAAIFEAVRTSRQDRTFDLHEIDVLDDALDQLGVPRDGDGWLPLALGLIKQFEGCRLTAYPDPGSGGDPWTIGYGSTGEGIRKGVSWTIEQCNARLSADVTRFAAGVDGALHGAATSAHQKAALVSLAYNIGLGNLGSSTLLRMHNSGDHAGAAAQFARWNKASGKVMAGLTRRRAVEAATYQGGTA